MISKYILLIVIGLLIYACSNCFKTDETDDESNWVTQKRVSFRPDCACAKQPYSGGNLLSGNALIKQVEGSFTVSDTSKTFFYNKKTNELFLSYRNNFKMIKGRVCNIPTILQTLTIPEKGLLVSFSANIFETCDESSNGTLNFDAILEDMLPVEY
jgi:hypothetical protein